VQACRFVISLSFGIEKMIAPIDRLWIDQISRETFSSIDANIDCISPRCEISLETRTRFTILHHCVNLSSSETVSTRCSPVSPGK
jgi:hypothetical protein